MATRTDNITIIGAGHSAGQLVFSIRQQGFKGKIRLLGEEAYPPYQRPPLSKAFLAGSLNEDRLFLRPEAFYHDQEIELITNCRVEDVHIANKSLTATHLSTGKIENYHWGKLVFATGAPPRKLTCPGADLGNIFQLRNIDDIYHMRPGFQPGKRLIIIGAGYIGLEAAAIGIKMGLNVHIIELAGRVLSRVTGSEISSFLENYHREAGVTIQTHSGVVALKGENNKVTHVELIDGSHIPCDLVIAGIGSIPATQIAEAAGLGVDNGIIVDEFCRTDHEDIYAIGDCTNHPNSIYKQRLRLESVHNALEQAKTAAAHLCGKNLAYNQIPWFWSDQYDIKLQTVGLWNGADKHIIRGNVNDKKFSIFYLRDRKLICTDAINDPPSFALSKKAILNERKLNPDDLADLSKDIKQILS